MGDPRRMIMVTRRMMHDMRNSLTALLGSLQLLEMKPEMPAARNGALSRALLSCRELMLLFGNLSDMIKIEDEDILLERKSVDLASIVDANLTTLTAKFTVEWEPDRGSRAVVCLADADFVGKLIRNIFYFVRRNHTGKTVTLGLSSGQGRVELRVGFSAADFSPAYLDEVVRKWPGSDGAKDYGGIDFGFALACGVIVARMLGGELRAISAASLAPVGEGISGLLLVLPAEERR